MTRIAVFGAGPKAAAIAAKSSVLNETFGTAFDLVVYEKGQPLDAWRGAGGYTDGEQLLCTIAERDLGFPYSHASFGSKAATEMFRRFSWASFCASQGTGNAKYESWVLNGRLPPTHFDFANYAEDALTRSRAILRQEEVVGVDFDSVNSQWKVTSDSLGSHQTHAFDGVVVTGSGPPLPALAMDPVATLANVFDGVTFWQHLTAVEAQIASVGLDDSRVCIVGAGGTAAAVAHWFVRRRIDVPITIIGREATLYGRRSGYFEDRLFTDEDEWDLLDVETRKRFVERQTSGVVWDYVLQRLENPSIRYRSGDVTRLHPTSTTALTPEVQVEYVPKFARRPTYLEPATIVVDARGFDRWWFRKLLRPGLDQVFGTSGQVQDAVGRGLTLTGQSGSFPPRFHAPMVASKQGPGASNLMSLGWMADRILAEYI